MMNANAAQARGGSIEPGSIFHSRRLIVMSWENIQADWQRHIGQVRIQWGKLTEEDLQQINGRRETLLEKIQERYKITRVQAEDQVKRFEAHN